ncbi:MAG: hypothetical protein LBT94_02480 [Prevotellaceae bacterium]|jgi:hypothetical protein|nr:hypothetical protein [Prevotellaceae bacterium]
MKITYNILWIEDELSWYDTTLELFKSALEEVGFELVSERKDNIQQIQDLIGVDGLKKFDMLLVDFTLKNSEHGDKIIKLIRNNNIYTDVLFYSSAVENIKQSISRHGLEGVYTADRKDIESKFQSVFLTTIKKMQEVNAIRGLIMGETSDLDVEIKKIYHLIIELPFGEELQSKIKNIFVVDYKEIKKNYIKQCKDKRNCYTSDYKRYFSLSDSFRRYDILKEILKLKSFKGFDLELFKQYKSEVIEIRNKFAHAQAEEKDGKTLLKGQLGKEDFEFDEARCIEIRKKLILHKNNIDKLVNMLSKNNM